MKIVFINGGLGNQVFQYIFFRWLQLRTQGSCYLDDSAFFGAEVPHNGYELEKVFGIKAPRLSQFFSPDVWQLMVSKRAAGMVAGISQVLREGGLDFPLFLEAGQVSFSGEVIRYEDMPPLPEGNAYYHGYYLHDKFFRQAETVLRSDLQFPPITDTRNLDYQAQIRMSNAVGIHVRRGDMAALGWSQPPEFFARQIAFVEQQVPYAHYFLFSDDLAWCHEHAEDLGLAGLGNRWTGVEGNTGWQAYHDLQLMMQCNYLIAGRSSFSLLACVLGHGR